MSGKPAPSLPFVIGILRVDGTTPNADIEAFRTAMTEPSLRSEFAGTVAAVATAPQGLTQAHDVSLPRSVRTCAA